jgi:hypothetical protein
VLDLDDYVDWLKWVSDEEKIIMMLLNQKMEKKLWYYCKCIKQRRIWLKIHSLKAQCYKILFVTGTRWQEICQKIWVDLDLEVGKTQQLWHLLKHFQDFLLGTKGNSNVAP